MRLRFAKTRGRARSIIEDGRIKVEGEVCTRIDAPIAAGTRLDIALSPTSRRRLRLLSLPHRRGPASEAQSCYELLDENANRSQQVRND